MKKTILFMVLAICFLYSVNADCSKQSICENQDTLPFCNFDDTQCKYVKYIEFEGACIKDPDFNETDSDNDNWTDSCDAFPFNNKEQVDFDGDSLGYNIDCDDFNYSNQEKCGGDENKNDPVNENENVSVIVRKSNPLSTGSRIKEKRNCRRFDWNCTEWEECVNDINNRTCYKINECNGDFFKPKEFKLCPVITDFKISSGDIMMSKEKEPEENLTSRRAFLKVPIEQRHDYASLFIILALALVFFFVRDLI
ncbi:hypothetical protein GF327_03010 [Candidatus Woesearchaeota archaeon]|nr:hypothetical protein [Candidatus Woesearchaeota archaeon]